MNSLAKMLFGLTLDEYERYLQHPDSTRGSFDPATGKGEVWFTTNRAAQAARLEEV